MMSRFVSIASGAFALNLACAQVTVQQESGLRKFMYDCADGLAGSLLDEVYTCRGARISDGEIEISAVIAETNKRDFAQSEWRLIDDVSVAIDSARLNADSAVFIFADDELVYFELKGTPAVLTDIIEQRNVTLTGSSDLIVYDKIGETVELTGEVRVAVDGNDFVTNLLTYNLADNTFVAGEVSATLSQTNSEGNTQPEPRDGP